MSDFKEMLFSETIKPLNWQDLQARDEEMEEVKQEQIKQDNQQMYHAHLYDEMKENGMSLEDFI
jgi:hypothetical protein